MEIVRIIRGDEGNASTLTYWFKDNGKLSIYKIYFYMDRFMNYEDREFYKDNSNGKFEVIHVDEKRYYKPIDEDKLIYFEEFEKIKKPAKYHIIKIFVGNEDTDLTNIFQLIRDTRAAIENGIDIDTMLEKYEI